MNVMRHFMNIVRYMMRNYYLGNICKGYITKEEVAKIYSTTVENVEKAVQEYKNNRNPFKKEDSQIRQGKIQIIISLLSAMLVLFTLFEMQAERNAAYMPNISINGSGIIFAWDKEHNLLNDISGFMKEELDTRSNLASSYEQSLFVKLAIQNTGIGIAKDVHVDWLFDENIPLWQKVFSENNDISISLNQYQLIVELSNGTTTRTFVADSGKIEYGFLTADLNESKELVIPREFVHLYELAFAHGLRKDLPDFRFNVFYKDVQGEIYKKAYVIHPAPLYTTENLENNGVGIVDLNIIEQKTEHISVFGKYKHLLLICGIVVVLFFAVIIISAILFEKNRRRIKAASKKHKGSAKSKLANKDELHGKEKGKIEKPCQ